MPLIKNVRSTTIWTAFILNSFATALILLITLFVHDHFAKYVDDDNDKVTKKTSAKSVIFTFLFAFAASMIAYTLMYFITGFGGGMLVNNHD